VADDRKRGFQAGSNYAPGVGPNPFLARGFSPRPKAPVIQAASAIEKAWIANEDTFCFDAFSSPSSGAPSEPEQVLPLRRDMHVSASDRDAFSSPSSAAPSEPERVIPIHPDLHVSTSDRVASGPRSRAIQLSSKPSRRHIRVVSLALLLGTALASSTGVALLSWKHDEGSRATARFGDGDRGSRETLPPKALASARSGSLVRGAVPTPATHAMEPARRCLQKKA
jgi:hypothetical protein